MSEITTSTEKWDKEIVPKRSLLDIPWRELWRYRDLVRLLALRDLTAQFKQTVLGPLWFVLQPLLTTFVFSFIFGRFRSGGGSAAMDPAALIEFKTAMQGLPPISPELSLAVSNLVSKSHGKSPTDHIPHFLFFMGGLIVWGFFAECANKTSNTFTKNAQLFGKVYFPRLAVPLAQVCTSLAGFAVQFCVFLAGLAFYWTKKHYFPDPSNPFFLDPNWRVLLLPVFLAQAAMLGVGVGLLVSAISTRYRDLAMATGFGVQLWMYGSSIAFPVSELSAMHQRILMLNPMVPVVEGMRFAFLGEGTVTKAYFAMSFAVSVVVFLAGIVAFNRAEKTVMDTV